MFLFIGGVQPKTVDLGGAGASCPRCFGRDVRRQRRDDYLSLFFIPLVRLREGETVHVCRSCGAATSPSRNPEEPAKPPTPEKQPPPPPYYRQCPHCRQTIEPNYSYCPFCGKKL